MANFQKIIVLGQLGRDAEIKNFPNGGGVMNMSVATSENWQKDGEWQSKTTWHNVKVFGKSVDYLAPKCVKGASVLVEGILNVDEYEKDGVKKYNTFIKASSVKVISGKQDGYQGQLQEQLNINASEDLPF
jgi:single-strand DNA-binding protein